jgi:hypothetical protein
MRASKPMTPRAQAQLDLLAQALDRAAAALGSAR